MAKAAEKATKAAAKAADVQPERAPAWIEVHGSDGKVDAVAPALVRTALRAWGMVRRIDELEDELKLLKQQLAAEVGEGRSLVVQGVCRVAVSRHTSVGIRDADKLRELLRERFDDLVEQSVSYKPRQTLIEMSSDGDDPIAPAYRALLTVRQSTAVRITAEK